MKIYFGYLQEKLKGENKMRKYVVSLFTFVLMFGVAVFISTINPVNSFAAGSVAAVVTCDNDVFGFGGNTDPTVEQSQVSINAPGCKCTQNEPDWPVTTAIDCDNEGTDENHDDRCTECLASLVRAGMSIISTSSIYDTEFGEQNTQHFLTGPAGPFLSRVGGCFCD